MTSSTGEDGDKVVPFRPPEITPEERARRLQNEVERLARLSVTEWMFWIDYGVGEQFRVDKATLTQMVERPGEQKERARSQSRGPTARTTPREAAGRCTAGRGTKRREQEREQERADKEAAKKNGKKRRHLRR
jgi:hypothetical protein